MSATGYAFDNLPQGKERDEVLGLIRIGQKFRAQQCGRRPDAITQYLAALVRALPRPTFAALLERLEVEASRRDLAARECVCVAVNRVWEVATFHHPRRGDVEISFGTLRNKFTSSKFIVSGNP